MNNLISRFLCWWFMPPEVKRGALSEEQYITAMSKAYQNPAIMQYLDHRELFLIAEIAKNVITDNLPDGKGVAGQLVEIRALRTRMRSCYNNKRNENAPVKKRSHSAAA